MDNKVTAVYCSTVRGYHPFNKKPCYYMVHALVVSIGLRLFYLQLLLLKVIMYFH